MDSPGPAPIRRQFFLLHNCGREPRSAADDEIELLKKLQDK
jgi:hypothetical protein